MHTSLPLVESVGLSPDQQLRHEIDAPAGFVSVFHETKAEYLASIASQGLVPESVVSNMGSPVSPANLSLDAHRPAQLVAAGVSRISNIYAYPYLERGHGLFGADQRFIPQKEETLRQAYEGLKTYQPDYLRKIGAVSVDSFLAISTSPEHLRNEYPGEVLELKVDPTKCYVADLERFNNIQDGKRRGWIREEDMSAEASDYWASVMTLSDFMGWYKLAEYVGDDIKDEHTFRDAGGYVAGGYFCPVKGAPEAYPDSLHYPEILIPDVVPAAHLKLL